MATRRKAKAAKSKQNLSHSGSVTQELPAPLPKIKDDNGAWHRLLRTLDYAVQQHVQGYTPGPRPRIADPGWEDLIELQAYVAHKISQIE